jgi:hypothetical protein
VLLTRSDLQGSGFAFSALSCAADGFAGCFNVFANAFNGVAGSERAEGHQGSKRKCDLFHFRFPSSDNP